MRKYQVAQGTGDGKIVSVTTGVVEKNNPLTFEVLEAVKKAEFPKVQGSELIVFANDGGYIISIFYEDYHQK